MAETNSSTANVQKGIDLFADEFSNAAPATENEATASPNVATEEKPVANRSQTTTSNDAAKFRREIDLGDGSGKQVFEADSAEALIDKLTTAQENATRKIREQQFELKRAQRAKPEREAATKPIEVGQPKNLTADELFALGQELQTNPASAFDKILQAQTGLNAAQLKAIGTEFATIQQQRLVYDAETSFLTNHQGVDYLPTPDNARAIQKFLQDEKLPYTATNLEYAFQELSEGGLLDMPDSAESTDSNTNDSERDNKDQEERIVVPQHTRRKPLSTGLRNTDGNVRQKVEQPTKNDLTEAEVEEIYRLPLEEARTKMLAKMRSVSASGSRK